MNEGSLFVKLHSLKANKPSFHTVNFKKEGPTLILGRQAAPGNKQQGKTYNGVGKSLIVRLVHFCLGTEPIEELEKKLPDWEFSLTFEIEGVEYTASRRTQGQRIIRLNNEDQSLPLFRKTLEEKIFTFEAGLSLSFRSLISRFIRPSKASYNEAEIFIKEERDYYQLLNNSFLLGLDPGLVKRKRDLRKEEEQTRKLKSNFNQDPILQDFYSGDRDASIELQDLEEKISGLERSLAAFDVAEDYHKIRAESDELSKKVRDLENKSVALNNAILNIDNSIKSRPDLPKEKVLSVYEEAKLRFKEDVKKTIDEVLEFHSGLLANRKKRLLDEKARLKKELFKTVEQRESLGSSLNQNFKYLNSHRALDEFVQLTNLCSDLKNRAQKLKDYQQLMKKYDLKLQELSISIKQENIRAQNYLETQADLISKNIAIFRNLSKEFYKDKPSGISIKNNDGDNQIRFNIETKIQDDASDGINEVKIFCFDMTLLKARHGHSIDFIFHDSRLFSNMDPRQRETLFRLAHKFTAGNSLQYIASVNEDQIESFRQEMSEEDFKLFIVDNISLELTDESAATKLLGIEIDMDYE